MSTDSYAYNVCATEDDPTDYLFAWHWHPDLARPECHLHVHAALKNGMTLEKKHLPTGRVSFEEVVRFLVKEQDVQATDDHEERLTTSQQVFEDYRTWAGARPK